ncbi:unnamed protein product [Closterium sp. NIES-53]
MHELAKSWVQESLLLIKLLQLSSLPASLGNLKSLNELKISECTTLTQLPASLSQLSSLEMLEISDCSKVTVLPQGMGDGLRSLRKLILLRCTALTRFPPSFSNLSSLETLKICDADSLRGTLPIDLTRWKSLKKLSLSSLSHLPALPAPLPAIARTLTSLVLLSYQRRSDGWKGSRSSGSQILT